MTAIYSYYSKEDKFAFIGADDLVTPQGTKLDKIYLMENRFAVATSGLASSENVISLVSSFEGRGLYVKHQSIEELAATLSCASRSLYGAVQEALQKDPSYNSIDYQAQPACYLIFDTQKFEMKEVNLGFPLLPNGHWDEPPIQDFLPQKLHLTALARDAANGMSYEDVEKSALLNVKEFLRNRIEEDRKKEPQIGQVGSIFIFEGGTFSLSTCFSSFQEYAEHVYSDLRVKIFPVPTKKD